MVSAQNPGRCFARIFVCGRFAAILSTDLSEALCVVTFIAELLKILRCPYCVNLGEHPPGSDPGHLKLVQSDTWLVCLQPGCGRKYPIREGVPVMLIDEGTKWIDTPEEALPQPGKLVN